ncbi:sulfatase [Aquirufa ecclesiirivi]|uniref:sulfatase family protein n=1 Tax=Aquirufa ecclesiirivi TaxID=2715124 RepID=UPI0022A8417C|nr:sulfatase-like hydrolase/transferase [Aquirufa ecclesiirivi]
MKKSFFVILLSLLTGVSLLGQHKKPNVLIILTDDQGYHDVSYYNSKDLNTPNIDKLREDGMRLDYFYANSPVCAPTRASLMSGRYPDFVGVPGLIRSHPENSWGYLDPRTILLPSSLKKLNYHTAHIGKWNLGLESPNLPNEKGFDYFHGWLEDMMDDYWTHLRHGKNFMRLNTNKIEPVGHATDLFTQWSVDYIHQQAKSKDPFFLYLAYNAPHFPVQPPKEWLDKVLLKNPGISEKRAKLVAFIEHLDDGIGKVIDALKQSGQYENTIIVFTSDNGGHLPDLANNGGLRDGKQSMYEGGLRVPTVISWPLKIPKGSNSNAVNLSMDIFPTIMELVGGKMDHRIEGRSFAKTLLNKSDESIDRPIYFTRREGGILYGGKAYHALRLGPWKLLQNSPFQPYELYDLKNDPLEKNNLVNTNPEMVKKLNAILMTYIQQGGSTPWQKPVNR